jgi:hypothetical protein
MVRTQIYLTEKEQKALQSLSRRTGKKQSELIREAIDAFIIRFSKQERSEQLQKAKGMWKDRNDLPDLIELRREWDRF